MLTQAFELGYSVCLFRGIVEKNTWETHQTLCNKVAEGTEEGSVGNVVLQLATTVSTVPFLCSIHGAKAIVMKDVPKARGWMRRKLEERRARKACKA